MVFDSAAPINRRTVAKGIAWSVPAVAIAGAAPAFALSGDTPTLSYQGACKFPGKSCAKAPFGYGFVFTVDNVDPAKAVYFCGATMSNISPANAFTGPPPVWQPPASGCVSVPADGEGELIFYFGGTNSANLDFTFDLTVQWSHECDCNDGVAHTPIFKNNLSVESTPPGGVCTCGAEFIPTPA